VHFGFEGTRYMCLLERRDSNAVLKKIIPMYKTTLRRI